MTKATNLLRAAIKVDGTTRKGSTAIRLIRGRYAALFLNKVSFELYESAMRTFDREIGLRKTAEQRTSWEREACK